jgi:predicted ABC-type ATPase
LLYVGTDDVSINMQRVRQRVINGGHDVPEEDQLRRYPRSLANFGKAFRIADEAIVFDNSTQRGHTRLVEKDKDGVTVLAPLPKWAESCANDVHA